jgi:crotonobetainyl-CoA:carnitine CoA-transferase CaiB-like acyl-CoA transferase
MFLAAITSTQDFENETSFSRKPLAGIKVVDLTTMLAGPYCARWLSDLGAEVIKIESLDGDYMRATAPTRDGRSAYFAHLNSGKQSLSVDLKTEAGIRIVRELAATSDVVLENFRPGVMQRFGLGYDKLRQLNQGLVCCSISGYGQTGPSAVLPAYAAMIHAASGFDLATMIAQDDAVRPQTCGVQIADVLAAIFACSAIHAALFDRTRTELGQSIDLSLFDGMLTLLPAQFQQMQFAILEEKRPSYKPLITNDGFVTIMPLTQNNFTSMCGAMGHEEWAADPRFSAPAARFRNWAALLEMMSEWTSQRSSLECEMIMRDGGVPAARYRSLGDAIADPQTAHREVVHKISDNSGTLNAIGLPFRFSGCQTPPGEHVPDLGEHTVQVLQKLGYDDAAITALREAKVIHCEPET